MSSITAELTATLADIRSQIRATTMDEYHVQIIAPGVALVTGGEQPYRVTESGCSCPHFQQRLVGMVGAPRCKHQVRASEALLADKLANAEARRLQVQRDKALLWD